MEKKLSLKQALNLSKKERAWRFSITKCNAEWLKCKNKYEDTICLFHIYPRPIAAFNEKRPLYLIGFKKALIANKINALIYYPNVGYVALYLYKLSAWQKMVRKQGSFVVIDGKKITIGSKGFEISEEK